MIALPALAEPRTCGCDESSRGVTGTRACGRTSSHDDDPGPASDLLRNRRCFVERNRPTRNALRQVLAVDQFQHQRLHAGRLLEPVNRRSMGMGQRGQRLGFAFEAREAIRVSGKRIGQDLDGDLPTQVNHGTVRPAGRPARGRPGYFEYITLPPTIVYTVVVDGS
jgi:hypothetical protein